MEKNTALIPKTTYKGRKKKEISHLGSISYVQLLEVTKRKKKYKLEKYGRSETKIQALVYIYKTKAVLAAVY